MYGVLLDNDMNEKHIIRSFLAAADGVSRLDEWVYDVHGFCPPNIRRFLNHLCHFPGCNYLEVGTYMGASLISAAHRNPGRFTGIDNFSEFQGTRQALDANLKRAGDNIAFYEGDCWTADRAQFQNVNVYYYDGNHRLESQVNGITYFYPCLANEFILMVDDHDWPEPAEGTRMALEALKFQVEFRLEIHDRDNKKGWWNGLLVLLCRKPWNDRVHYRKNGSSGLV